MGDRANTHRAAEKGLVDITTVAERLGVTVRDVRRLVAERRIPYVKFGHYLRFDPADVEQLIDRGRVEAFMPRSHQGRRAS